MAILLNIETREQTERTLSMERRAADAYSQSTGWREVVKYTDTWDQMLAKALEAVSGSRNALQVTAELERLPAGLAELTVTTERFQSPAGGGEEGEDDGDSGGSGAGSELGTEAAPCYSMSSTLVQVSILAHPKFAGLADVERRALKAMMDGQDENSLIEIDALTESGVPMHGRIKDCIVSEAAQKAFSYISRGITVWNEISTEATARWKGSNNNYKPGMIVDAAPGGFEAGAGRNWLCSGAGREKNGSETWCTASFRLSGVGGWDAYLYGNE